ncbi:MAG: hypothetical protein ACRCTJ_06780 [Brevinema sp.]
MTKLLIITIAILMNLNLCSHSTHFNKKLKKPSYQTNPPKTPGTKDPYNCVKLTTVRSGTLAGEEGESTQSEYIEGLSLIEELHYDGKSEYPEMSGYGTITDLCTGQEYHAIEEDSALDPESEKKIVAESFSRLKNTVRDLPAYLDNDQKMGERIQAAKQLLQKGDRYTTIISKNYFRNENIILHSELYLDMPAKGLADTESCQASFLKLDVDYVKGPFYMSIKKVNDYEIEAQGENLIQTLEFAKLGRITEPCNVFIMDHVGTRSTGLNGFHLYLTKDIAYNGRIYDITVDDLLWYKRWTQNFEEEETAKHYKQLIENDTFSKMLVKKDRDLLIIIPVQKYEFDENAVQNTIYIQYPIDKLNQINENTPSEYHKIYVYKKASKD